MKLDSYSGIGGRVLRPTPWSARRTRRSSDSTRSGSRESWGNDAFTYGAYLAAHTSRIKIGTGVVQIAARTPTATAMAAVTLDHLSNGRFVLGLGVSGPQVVEGWYGSPSRRPFERTREYVEIIRRALRREGPLTFEGAHYQLPYTGEGSSGLGKPLKIMTHPLRADLPIYLGAEGPRNVAQTAEIADGWLPLYYSPFRQEVYADQLTGARPGFAINALATFEVNDDVGAALQSVRAGLAFYIGGMGAKGQNYHTRLMARMGFEEEAYRIQDLFFEGRRGGDRRGAGAIRRRDLVGRTSRPHPEATRGVGGESRHDAHGLGLQQGPAPARPGPPLRLTTRAGRPSGPPVGDRLDDAPHVVARRRVVGGKGQGSIHECSSQLGSPPVGWRCSIPAKPGWRRMFPVQTMRVAMPWPSKYSWTPTRSTPSSSTNG